MPTYPVFFAFPEAIDGGDPRKRAGASRLPTPAPSRESVSLGGGLAFSRVRGTDHSGVRGGVGIGELAVRRDGRRCDLKGHYVGSSRGSEYARIRPECAENPCR